MYSFYEKYNPTKIHEIPKLLEKYKGQEQELIRKLEKKYGTATPVANTFGQNTATFGQSAATPFGAQSGGTPFGATGVTPFGATGITPFGAQSSLGGVSGNSTPFGQQSTSTFGQNNAPTQFGQTSFNKPVQTPFGQTGATTFGLPSQTSSTTQFGQTPLAFNQSPVLFGQTPSGQQSTFGQSAINTPDRKSVV